MSKYKMKKVVPVKMKSGKAITAMVRSGEIRHAGGCDSGEFSRYMWGDENTGPIHSVGLWFDDPGSEYLIVDHPNPISRCEYENMKSFFEEEE